VGRPELESVSEQMTPCSLLRVKRLSDRAILPRYAHDGDSGLDLFATESVSLPAGAIGEIGTGIAIELPSGTEGQIRARSGLAAKHGITVLNSPGTVDQGYRGEIRVILVNHGNDPFTVEPGMKIAQLVVQPVLRVSVEAVDQLGSSERGDRGFGSTGNR
jgi:dUTP pyrophosphatase